MLRTDRESSSTPLDDSTESPEVAEALAPERRLGKRLTLAAGVILLIVLGLLAIQTRNLVNQLLIASPTPTSVLHAATATASPTAAPTITPLPSSGIVPSVTISVGVWWTSSGRSAIAQTCQAGQPLQSTTIEIDNGRSTISADWWIDLPEKTPDGKLPWASTLPPYGTLAAGQAVTVTVWPDPTLCTQLAGKTSAESYHATVFYAGIGGAQLTDVVTPPPGSPATATPTANLTVTP